jgi:hypothetical protein
MGYNINMTHISGPVNLIRMEGKVNGINKIFYFFMDFHLDPNIQMECEDIHSKNVKDYLVSTFDRLKSSNHKIDFFLETFPDMSGYTTNYSGNYLAQLRHLFERIFKFNFKQNKVMKSKEFPNLRLHYIDIRSYFTFSVGNPFGIVINFVNHIFHLAHAYIDMDSITVMRDTLKILHSQISLIYDAFANPKKTSVIAIRKFPQTHINYTDEEKSNLVNYFINKIKNKYSNQNIKNKMTEIMANDLTYFFDEYANLYNKLNLRLDSATKEINHGPNDKITYGGMNSYFRLLHSMISTNIINDLYKLASELEKIAIELYTTIMDLYFLRRTLDKDYVTNSIVYTGAYHSANYIRLLVNEFDFKITHAYYSEINDMNKLNEQIKKISNSKEPIQSTEKMLKMFLPPKLTQCIDISKFPENFS